MQLTLAAFAAAITLAAAEKNGVPNFYGNRCSNMPFPNGYDAGIGPTDCAQLVNDCGYYGNGQVCTPDYQFITNCRGGRVISYGDYCWTGSRCLAAVDGSGAYCMPSNQPAPAPAPAPSPPNRCSNNPFPNGQGAGIGPTDCGQLVRDCGNTGSGQVCSTVYDRVVNCFNGQEDYSQFSETCSNGERCLAAVDGSGARCVR